jgi:hypothetical protein
VGAEGGEAQRLGKDEERAIRAARNQAMFRAVNENITQLNSAHGAVADRYAIACECADASCLEMLEISPDEYAAVRRHPRRFPVLPGHVYPNVERVVAEREGYVVVEKVGAAGEIAEATAAAQSG